MTKQIQMIQSAKSNKTFPLTKQSTEASSMVPGAGARGRPTFEVPAKQTYEMELEVGAGIQQEAVSLSSCRAVCSLLSSSKCVSDTGWRQSNSDRGSTHIVQVCGQTLADLLQLREATPPLLLRLLLWFLFDLTLGRALDALVQRALALDQPCVRCVHLLHRNRP